VPTRANRAAFAPGVTLDRCEGLAQPRIPFIAVRDLQMPFARTDVAVHLTTNGICGRGGNALRRIAPSD